MRDKKKPAPTTAAKIRWDDNGQPISEVFDDIYFSKDSGALESHYVFFAGNKLEQRWQTNSVQPSSVFNIGETGFGTGLNFLVTWNEWQKISVEKPRLHFISTEKYPLSRADMQHAFALWPHLSELSQQLLDAYPPQPFSGFYRMAFDNNNVMLTIYFGEASEGFEQLAAAINPGPQLAQALRHCTPRMHAWYLDGFAPAKNPQMWTQALFAAMNKLSTEGSTFATFTAAGEVRRALVANGFQCEKIKGYGHKREMLIGSFTPEKPRTEYPLDEQTKILRVDKTRTQTSIPIPIPIPIPISYNTAAPIDPQTSLSRRKVLPEDETWQVLQTQRRNPITHCIVVGGGLAACHTAFALASRGIKVTLLEKHPQLAQEASGNRQGIVYAKLSPHPDALSRFNLKALLFANRFYRRHGFYRKFGDDCGVLHLASDSQHAKHYQQLAQQFVNEPEFCRWLAAEQCATVSGLRSDHGGLFVPQAGWLAPGKVCQELVLHPHIDVQTNMHVDHINCDENRCKVSANNGTALFDADIVVMANAHDMHCFPQTQHLPLKRIRGQVTHLPPSPTLEKLSCVICGDGYIAPCNQDGATSGASFNLHDDDPSVRTSDNQENLSKLQRLSPDFASLPAASHADTLLGKVGFRCTTPDYFPVVGPVPNDALTLAAFADYRKRANAMIDTPGQHYPNLFCLTGLGSRGLCYSPLIAEVLASTICAEFLPISQSLYRHLHPARFLIRNLKRNLR